MLFFDLIQIALGHKTELSHAPSDEEWKELYALSKKQTLLGITAAAIEKIPAHQRPAKPLLLQWYVTAEHIKDLNESLNIKAVKISEMFYKHGFRNIILKGQGIAKLYEIAQLEKYRTPGDIDIWLEGSRENIVEYVRKSRPNSKVVYHHIDFGEIDGVDVEIHSTPSWMNCYFTNKKLQNFFSQCKDDLFRRCDTLQGDIPTPSLYFNSIYILIHIYRHLFQEGIGLRQLMDYYFVLRQGLTESEAREAMEVLRSLRMERFAGAVMWIMQEVFGLEEAYMLTTPSEKDGRFLLNEIMISGNFGQYDIRVWRNNNESDLSHAIRKIKRSLSFIHYYPSEVVWSPLFKLWHYFWRRKANNTK